MCIKVLLCKQSNTAFALFTVKKVLLKEEATRYRSVVASLNYLSQWTRPDIAFAVSKLSKFMSNPGPKHFKLLKRVLRYLLAVSFMISQETTSLWCLWLLRRFPCRRQGHPPLYYGLQVLLLRMPYFLEVKTPLLCYALNQQLRVLRISQSCKRSKVAAQDVHCCQPFHRRVPHRSLQRQHWRHCNEPQPSPA